MSRKPQQKLASIAEPGVSNSNDGLKKAALIRITPDGKINKEEFRAKFLLNPASYEENKGSNWIPNNVPGQSHPVYQWVSGGPRIVTFEALITRDGSHYPEQADGSFLGDLADAAIKVVGDIASSFAGIDLPPVTDLFPQPDPTSGNQLSISPYLDYYRSLLYPTYTEDYKLSQSPPLVGLLIADTFSQGLSGDFYTPPGGTSTPYFPVWMVTNINIRVTKQLPNLNPMEAFVTFTLHEYPAKPISIGNLISILDSSSSGLGGIGGLLGF